MKNTKITIFFLLATLIPALSYAGYVPAKGGEKHSINPETREFILEKEELLRKIDLLQKTVDQIQSTKLEDQKLISDKFSLIRQGSLLSIGILTIVLALMGLAGIAVYKLIDYKLTTKYQCMLDEGSTEIFFKIYKSLSHGFYAYYRTFFSANDYQKHPSFLSGVDLAIWYAEGMLKTAENFDDTRKDKTDILLDAKSHMAYHYATRGLEDDLEKAISIIDGFPEHSTPSSFNSVKDWADIRETVAWVKIRTNDPDMKKEGYAIINEILKNKAVPRKIRDELQDNYEKLESNSDWITD